MRLLSIAKLQNLKAIHNVCWQFYNTYQVVINRKTTKFESNSQLLRYLRLFSVRCYQSQNYKIWKQFTTAFLVIRCSSLLLSIAKLQNLKAIHNLWIKKILKISLLSIAKLQNLKAIHNPPKRRMSFPTVVINRKTTKFESNSQPNAIKCDG